VSAVKSEINERNGKSFETQKAAVDTQAKIASKGAMGEDAFLRIIVMTAHMIIMAKAFKKS
jgi:hypothetical protein